MIAPGTTGEYCTIAEAAALLRVSKPTISRWIASGLLPAKRVGPRVVRIRRTAIDRLMCGSGSDAPADVPWWKQYAISLGDPTVSEAELMADIESVNKEILARRGGKPLESSLPLIHESRR